MRIYLIRHGKTPGNQLNRYIGITDEPVLEEDQEQLKKQNYPKAERLFVSPLLRCRQTAACIYPGQEQQVIQNLRECDFGRFENKNWKEMTGDAEYQAWLDFLATGGTANAWEALYGTATGIQPLLPDTAFGKIYY